jgi:bacillolysin
MCSFLTGGIGLPDFSNSRLIAKSLLLLLVSFGISMTAAFGQRSQLDRKDRLKELPSVQKVRWDEEQDVPTFISGQLAKEQRMKGTPEQAALKFLKDNNSLFQLNKPGIDLNVAKVNQDGLRATHVKINQSYRGIPVYGSEMRVHMDQRGTVYAFNGQYRVDINLPNTSPSIIKNRSIEIAKSDLGNVTYRADAARIKQLEEISGNKNLPDWSPNARLMVYPYQKSFRLVWEVEVFVEQPEPGNWKYYIDAQSGSILHKYNALPHQDASGSGTSIFGGTLSLATDYSGGTYVLRDVSRRSGARNGGAMGSSDYIQTYTANNGSSTPGSTLSDSDNNWSSDAAVDAHHNAGVVYDYYYDTHNRNSFDDNGASIISTVHYQNNYNNAYWDGSQMVYGDGDGSTFIPLVCLDIVGHELTHAVTENTAGLVYQDESGALNESVSDIFAIMIDRDDWMVGEESYTPGTSGDALRYFDDPTQGNQPDHYSDLYTGSQDNGGVHTNSGIPNKATYLMVAGGTHHNVTVTGVGRTAVEKIWYRALSNYLTAYSDFADARSSTLQAASDLYGSSSAEYDAVADAWAAVGIGSTSGGGGGGGGSTDTYESNDTFAEAYGPLDSGTTYSSYIASSSDDDYYMIETGGAGTIDVSLANFPGDYDVYLYDSSQSELDKGYTTNDPETISYSASSAGTFYIRVDGYNGASSTSDDYELTVTYPTSGSGGGGGGTPQWYYETITKESPHPYPNYYNQSQYYSKAGAQKVAVHFSRFETERNYDFVYIYDQNGTQQASYNGTKSAFWAVVDGDEIEVNLDSDYSVTKWGYKIDQVAYYSDQQLFAGGNGTPVDGQINGTPSDQVDPNATKADQFALNANYPNPFNPSTKISYQLAKGGDVTLTIYNSVGQHVATLVNNYQNSGSHKITWNAGSMSSGIYFYQIDVDAGDRQFSQRRKMLLIK